MRRQIAAPRGFTLVEMAVSLGLLALTGGMLFSSIRTVMLLGAKNSAVNVTHQQSREMIHKAVEQLHNSVAIPSLADASLATVAGNGPAAGVTYQTMVAGPYKVYSSAAVGTNVLRITGRASDPAPTAGMRLIVPAFRLEEDITAVANLGGTPRTYNVTVANNLTAAITCSNGSPNYVAYYTQRAALVVVNGALRHYPRISAGTYSTVALGLNSPTPFSIPSAGNRFIQASFDVRDPRIAGLNLKSMSTLLQLTVPYRYRLTNYQ